MGEKHFFETKEAIGTRVFLPYSGFGTIIEMPHSSTYSMDTGVKWEQEHIVDQYIGTDGINPESLITFDNAVSTAAMAVSDREYAHKKAIELDRLAGKRREEIERLTLALEEIAAPSDGSTCSLAIARQKMAQKALDGIQETGNDPIDYKAEFEAAAAEANELRAILAAVTGSGEAIAEEFKFDEFDPGQISDGYHTFDELYWHRAVLFSAICRLFKSRAWKSRLHSDGTMFENMFIAGIETPAGMYTYHVENSEWDLFDVEELPNAPEWDGHEPKDAVRLHSLETIEE